MGVESAEAVILDVFDLHEYDRIITFLSAEHGKKRAVARSARRKHSRFGGQIELLATVRVEWFEHPRRELGRINSIERLGGSFEAGASLEDLLLRAYLADHMNAFAQENEDGGRLYRLLRTALDALEQGLPPGLVARYYETWLLRLAGVLGDGGACPNCGRSLEEAGAALGPGAETIVCGRCAGSGAERLSDAARGVYLLMRRLGLAELARVAIDQTVLDEIESTNGAIRRTFLQQELNSYRVMRETLARLPRPAARRKPARDV